MKPIQQLETEIRRLKRINILLQKENNKLTHDLKIEKFHKKELDDTLKESHNTVEKLKNDLEELKENWEIGEIDK